MASAHLRASVACCCLLAILGNASAQVTPVYDYESANHIFGNPAGTGPSLSEQGVSLGVQVTTTSWYNGFPISRELLWWDSPDQDDLFLCSNGTIADHGLASPGVAMFSGVPSFGGHSDVVTVFGDGFEAVETVPIVVNSTDINGDGSVNMLDVSVFAGDYNGTYHYRSDFNLDGILNLIDVSRMGMDNGVSCP